MNIFIVRCVTFIVSMLSINSYALTSSKLDQKIQQVTNHYLQQHGIKHGFTAVEVSVLLPNETKPRNYVVGTVSKQSNKLATTDMFVQYGSNTKMFTASLIIQLINKKMINYDTILAAIFPEKFTVHDANAWPLAWKSITIKQLLDMTSGIPDIFRTRKIWAKVNLHDKYSLNDLVNFVANFQQTAECNKIKGCFKTGTKWSYSNTNYFLLGLVVEKYYKMSFADAMNQYILQPFHEKGVAVYYDLKSPKDAQPDGLHAYYGFTEFNGFPYLSLGTDAYNIPLYWANSAGAMTGTASGLAQIGYALFHHQIIDTAILTTHNNILNTQTAKPITGFKKDCQKLCYGLGVELRYEPGFGTVYQYEGGTFGFATLFNWFADKNIVIVISQNSSSDTSDLDIPKHHIYRYIVEFLQSRST